MPSKPRLAYKYAKDRPIKVARQAVLHRTPQLVVLSMLLVDSLTGKVPIIDVDLEPKRVLYVATYAHGAAAPAVFVENECMTTREALLIWFPTLKGWKIHSAMVDPYHSELRICMVRHLGARRVRRL